MKQATGNFNDKGSIFIKFTFLGGLIGGLILGFIFVLLPPSSPFQSAPFWTKLVAIPFSVILGVTYGLLPSSLTALWVVLRKISFHRQQDYGEILLIGFLMTSSVTWLIRPILDKDIVIFGTVGAIAAVITSFIIFRKNKEKQ